MPRTKEPSPPHDLRTALGRLQETGELQVVDQPTEPRLAVARAYSPYAGIPARPPTREGPALLFTDVGQQHHRLAVGIFGSRGRVLGHIGAADGREAHDILTAAIRNPVPTRDVAPTSRMSHGPTATAMPVPLVTSSDAGPFITLGLVMARGPVSGDRNVSVHRICVQSDHRLTIWIVPGRDLGALAAEAWETGGPLPISVNVGLDPAVLVASCMTGAPVPAGFDELSLAGALRGRALDVVNPKAASQAPWINHAEWVVHGDLVPGPMPERATAGGASMPEFLGYGGAAHPGLPVVEVREVSSRPEPVYQTVVGPGLEQSVLLGLGMEVDVLWRLSKMGIPWAVDAHASPAGGGQLLVFIAARVPNESSRRDLVTACRELLQLMKMIKILVLVDSDVALDDHADLWWAVTTRAVPSRDILIEENAPGFPLDPSQGPEGAGSSGPGRTSKVLIDAMVPPSQWDRFDRVELGR